MMELDLKSSRNKMMHQGEECVSNAVRFAVKFVIFYSDNYTVLITQYLVRVQRDLNYCYVTIFLLSN